MQAMFFEPPEEGEGEGQRKKKEYLNPTVRISTADEDEWLIRNYRFPKAGITFLCNLLEEQLTPMDGGRGKPIEAEIQILTTLTYLATNTIQLVTGRLSQVSQQSVSNIVKRVTTAIEGNKNRFIYFPREEVQVNRIKHAFYARSQFPGVCCAIDCSHVKIECSDYAPFRRDDYVNKRKGFPTLNIFGACDNKLKFLFMDASHCGKDHDSYILQASEMWHFFSNNNYFNSIVVADKGFPQRDWLMTPFRRTDNEAQARYNASLASARSSIENAWALWKRRWSIMHSGCKLKLESIPAAVIATGVLHNLAIEMKVPILDDLPNVGPDDDDEEVPWELNDLRENIPRNEYQARLAGIRKRDEIVTNCFTNH